MNPSSHNADELRINIDGMFSEGQVLYVKSGLLKAVELITLNVSDIQSDNLRVRSLKFKANIMGPQATITDVQIMYSDFVIDSDGVYNLETKELDASVAVRFRVTAVLKKIIYAAANPLYAREILSAGSGNEIGMLDEATEYSFGIKRNLSLVTED